MHCVLTCLRCFALSTRITRVVDSPTYVFALAVDLGRVNTTAEPVAWAVGRVRDPNVIYTTPLGVQETRKPYYVTHYPDISTAVHLFPVLSIASQL